MSVDILRSLSKRAFAGGDKATGIRLKEAVMRQEKRDHAYKLLLAYAEYFSLPFTKQQELLTQLNFDSAEQLRANALEAAMEAK